ncbi:uncharacterized protein LOC129910152 [Episyrphus balteatus]|uniref:uncharacterized protein LOC129910152 n=1 Tax=Episyrphus balteatus TaxID=286459 RepID=UPI00248532B2|nr:uncharacterized protein LOC129910152 [Episyrphus balteatus]
MLKCSQLKLSERRSVPKLIHSNTVGDSIVVRPCTQRNITEVPQKLSHIQNVTEKRLPPELRVISLNLEDQPNTNNDKKITRTPYRMPLFCTHFKSLKKNYQRDKKNIDENFIVRGFEVGSAATHLTSSNVESNTDDYDPDEDDLNFLRNGIQIQLTDCCQCVCDLFNSSFPISHDSHEMSYVTIETCNSLRPFRQKDLVSPTPRIETQPNNLLDPDILKVIRVTMNNKNLTDCK